MTALADAILFEALYQDKVARCAAYNWCPPDRKGYTNLVKEIAAEWLWRSATGQWL
jgi:hypothetical protein